LPFTIDPVYCLINLLQIVVLDAWIDVFLEWAIVSNVVSHVIEESFKLVLDSLELKNVFIFLEPCLLSIDELSLDLWG
jgi:hypothetical protein